MAAANCQLCNMWPRNATGERPLAAPEVQWFFDPEQPPMVAARAAVQETTRRRVNKCRARERAVLRLLSAKPSPADEVAAVPLWSP